MKKFSLLAVAAFAAVSAFAQDHKTMDHKMGMKKPMMAHTMKMDPMMGLTPAEKKVAMMHMKKMTSMEMGAHKHFMQAAMMGKSDKDAMKSLSKADQVTLEGMMKKMSPMEMKVAMKMSAHARMMGMKKGMKAMPKMMKAP